MFIRGKLAVSLFSVLILLVLMVLIGGCGSATQEKPINVKQQDETKKQDGNIEKIIVYGDPRASVYEPDDEHFEALSKAVSEFLEFDFAGGIRWADAGNDEFIKSSRSGKGVLVIFTKPVEPRGKPYNERPYKLKRLYIPLSGELVEGNFKLIVLHSHSEYDWSWDGFYTYPLDKAKLALGQLQAEVSKLPAKDFSVQ